MARIHRMAASLLSMAMAVSAASSASTTTPATSAPTDSDTDSSTTVTDIAGVLATLLPTAPPTTTENTAADATLSAICQSTLFAAFFLHAAPSDDLATALSSYGASITSEACAVTPSVFVTDPASTPSLKPDCSPAPSLWCDFPKVAPSSVLSKYTSYGRAAASFLPEGLAPLLDLATECPQNWYAAATMFPQGPDDLHDLVVLGECFASARDENSATATKTGTATTATATGSGKGDSTATGKGSATGTGTATGTPKPNAGGRISGDLVLYTAVSASIVLFLVFM